MHASLPHKYLAAGAQTAAANEVADLQKRMAATEQELLDMKHTWMNSTKTNRENGESAYRNSDESNQYFREILGGKLNTSDRRPVHLAKRYPCLYTTRFHGRKTEIFTLCEHTHCHQIFLISRS